MPAKKKKGKGSKLARMSEEERLRYLQHRAELELEAKRRKQELIAVFTKNKLKREEAFARINTAKINEQWRFILRQIKCKQLYDEVDYLWKNFDRTLRAKDAIIHKLYDELERADLDNRKLQESHIDMIDRLIGSHKERLESMRNSFNISIGEKEKGEMEELNVLHGAVTRERRYLETVIFAQERCIEDRLTETKTRNAVSTRRIEHWRNDEIASLRKRVGGEMENLWRQLNGVISDYETESRQKRKQYEYLKAQDDSMQAEAAQFPRLQTSYQTSLDILEGNYEKLEYERRERIKELTNWVQRTDETICKSRQEIRIRQMMDEVQLKRLSVLSVSVIKKLKRTEERGSALLLLIKMCSKLEPTSLVVKKYAIHNSETVEEANVPCVTSPYDKMDKFWEQYNYVKAGNIHLKSEHEQLMQENKSLRHRLRNYLITLSRAPASKSRNLF